MANQDMYRMHMINHIAVYLPFQRKSPSNGQHGQQKQSCPEEISSKPLKPHHFDNPKERMSSFTHATTLLHAHIKTKQRNPSNTNTKNKATTFIPEQNVNKRRLISTFLAASIGAVVGGHGTTTPALAQNWGTRSFLKEHFFEAGLSPEDAVERIKQTAEGLHSLREMLETMCWRYVLFYIRLKMAYLDQDLKNAITTLPLTHHKDYIKIANELVDYMTEFDRYVRTPKVYESYLYYEKTLKSIDELVAMFT